MTEDAILVECTECHFQLLVEKDAGESPAAIVREHGGETGHLLRVSSTGEREGQFTSRSIRERDC